MRGRRRMASMPMARSSSDRMATSRGDRRLARAIRTPRSKPSSAVCSDSRGGCMDATTTYLSDYACALSYADLSLEAIHQAKRSLIDTLGCGIGGYRSEPATIARRLASRVDATPSARLLCTRDRTAIDLAAFANTVLVRYLD